MKSATLEEYYQKAMKQLPRRSATIVIELVEEVQRLRALHTARKAKRGESLDDDCEISFGDYRNERLADVPDDYLSWWRSQMNIDALNVDAMFANQPEKSIAQQKIRLYEYITKRLGTAEEARLAEEVPAVPLDEVPALPEAAVATEAPSEGEI